ncbi:MAG: hypothetical protein IPQ05_20410 [Leptospiraceae bacterium]|nr:hypothetical protein [Leptospiraceae bacterium]MBL0266160.1 hypothetical protein [Leptospiraceae bacterium]
MRNSIFKLEVVTYEGIVKYPKELDFDHLGYFRNPLQAERFMKELKSNPVWKSLYSLEKNPKDQTSILFFKLAEYSVDRKNEIVLSTRIYGKDLNLYHSRLKAENLPFTGRKESEIFFRKGDIIEFIQSNGLHIGIIGEAPWTREQLKKIMKERKWKTNLTDQVDDCYYVLYGKDKFSHAHPPTYFVFKPTGNVSQKVQKMLRDRLESRV